MIRFKKKSNFKTCLGTSYTPFRINVNSSSFFSLVLGNNNMGARNFVYDYKYNLPYNTGKTYVLKDGRVIHYEHQGPRGVSDLNKPEHIGKIIAILKPLVVKADCGVGIFSPQFNSIRMLFEERFDVYFPVHKYIDLLKDQLGHNHYLQQRLDSGLHYGFPGFKLNDKYFFDLAQLIDGNYCLPILMNGQSITSYMNMYTKNDYLHEVQVHIAQCLIRPESGIIDRDSVLTYSDLGLIQEYLKTQQLIGCGTPDKPEFDYIICSIDFIKNSIEQIWKEFGFKFWYGRFYLESEPRVRLRGFKYMRLNPRILKAKSSELNDETNTSEDNDNQ